MALIQEYFDLTKKYTDEYGASTILLMQVGSFFEVYGLINKNTNANANANANANNFTGIPQDTTTVLMSK